MWKYKTGGSVWSVSITPDGEYVVAGSRDKHAYLFNKKGELLWKYETGGDVYSVSITPDGEYVVAGSRDNHVYLFNKKGELLWKYETDDEVESVSITPDGEYVVAESYNDNVYLFVSSQAMSKIINNYYIYAYGITILGILTIIGGKYYIQRRRKKEYERKMKEFKSKVEKWKKEGYDVSELEEMLK